MAVPWHSGTRGIAEHVLRKLGLASRAEVTAAWAGTPGGGPGGGARSSDAAAPLKVSVAGEA